ncbi:MAG: hypothetical protein ACXW4K_05065 [Candidatus Deferrimicrobiaceae bacterium]
MPDPRNERKGREYLTGKGYCPEALVYSGRTGWSVAGSFYEMIFEVVPVLERKKVVLNGSYG